MADQAIKYTVTAETSGFAVGMQSVARSLDNLRGLTGNTNTTFQDLARSMSQHMAEVGRTISSEVTGMAGHFGGLLEAVGASRAGMVALVGAAAGLAASKAVNATAEMTESAMDLARVLGDSTNVAQTWRLALEDVGGTQDELQAAAKGMSKQLKENEDAMQAMGLQTRDAAGNLRPMNDLLTDGLDVLNGYKEGADRALAAQQIFGRGVDSSSKLLLINRDTLDDARETMAALGLEVGANAVAAWKSYDAATDRAGFSMRGLGNTIGTILMPVLTDVIGIFNAAMPAAITVVRGAVGGLATVWHGLANGAAVAGEVMMAVIYTVTEPLRSLGSAMVKLVQGDFKGATDEMMGWPSRVGAYWNGAMNNMVASSQQARDRIAAIWGAGDAAPGAPEGDRGTKGYTPPPDKAKAGKEAKEPAEKSRMAEFEAALALDKEAAAREDARREYSKEQEAAYWRNILATTVLGKKDTLAVVSKFTALETQVIREQAKQMDQIEAGKLDARMKSAEDAVALAQSEGQSRVAAGDMSKGELLQQERTLQEGLMALRREYLMAKLGMVDPDRDPVQYAQRAIAIEQAEMQHQLRMSQIVTQQATVTAQESGRIWDSLGQSMSGLWDKGIQAMMNGTLTWRNATRAIGAELVGWFSNSVVKPNVMAWLFGETAKTGATTSGNAARLAIEGAAAVKSVAIWAWSSIKKIMMSAWEGMAAAWAAISAIPVVGPVLAPVVAAGVFAGVAGLVGNISSASGGFDIPAGVNPLTQLHAREMVLPAEHADTIRRLGRDGETFNPAPAPEANPVHVYVTNNIRALDGPSVKRILMDNTSALADSIKKAVRDASLTRSDFS